jgi:hypothetical protein
VSLYSTLKGGTPTPPTNIFPGGGDPPTNQGGRWGVPPPLYELDNSRTTHAWEGTDSRVSGKQSHVNHGERPENIGCYSRMSRGEVPPTPPPIIFPEGGDPPTHSGGR